MSKSSRSDSPRPKTQRDEPNAAFKCCNSIKVVFRVVILQKARFTCDTRTAEATIVGGQTQRGCDIWDPAHSVFPPCLSALPNMATCREEQTLRLALGDARLLYIMFLACHRYFPSSPSYSKHSGVGQVPADAEAALNKPVAVIRRSGVWSGEVQQSGDKWASVLLCNNRPLDNI